MKIGILISSLLFSTFSYASCDWSLGITKINDDYYKYTTACHKRVGLELKKSESLSDRLKYQEELIVVKEKEVLNYKYLLDLEKKSTNLWKTTSIELDKQIKSKEFWDPYENILYFIGGVLTTSLIVGVVNGL